MMELSIALGIVVNLLLTELTGFTAAGLVVPGYLALYLMQPSRLLATAAVSAATWALVRFGWARLAILYGRRRTAITVLTGLVLNAALDYGIPSLPPLSPDLRVIGYIVPGLIAGECLSQGVRPTVLMTLLCALLVRLLLWPIYGLGW